MKKKQIKKGKKPFQSEDTLELRKPKRQEKRKRHNPKAWLDEALEWSHEEQQKQTE